MACCSRLIQPYDRREPMECSFFCEQFLVFFLSLNPCLPLVGVLIHMTFRQKTVNFQHLGYSTRHAGDNSSPTDILDVGSR